VRPAIFLEDNLFRKIVGELRALKYTGRFTFNMFNEPLLDKRLPSFIAYVREKLPSVLIYLNTNGDLLNFERWQALRSAGLDYARISQYDGKLNDNIIDFLTYINEDERGHMMVRIFDTETNGNNMAGLVKSRRNAELPLKLYCPRPFFQLCVNYKGKVPFCCLDYLASIQLGDVRKQSLMEIWTSKKYAYYRFWLVHKNRARIKLCRSCDNMETAMMSLPIK
jgi:radical SAM protein with 4Fe4S-binding SPASM domain